MKLDSKQSHYVLQALLAKRQVRASRVREILRDRDSEIAALRTRLAALEALGGAAAVRSGASTRGRGPRMSPRLRALRRLQGRYMGLVRRLRPAEKARVRGLREKQGLPAAIRLAASLGRT